MTPEEVVQAVVSQSETMTRPVYRGQADADWLPQSGAVRRLKEAYGEDFPVAVSELRRLVSQYHRDNLIMPMEVIDGSGLSDPQRLSVLQHQGAATGLLDFTENPLIALWFACNELPEKNAKIFVLDIGDPQVARNARTLEDPLDAEQSVLYYEPDRSLGARIVAQRSVLVICNPVIPNQLLKSIAVPRNSKGPLRDYLSRLGLSETALFGDIPGTCSGKRTRQAAATHRPAYTTTASGTGKSGLSGGSVQRRTCCIRVICVGTARCGSGTLPQGRYARRPRTIRRRGSGLHESNGEPRSANLSWRTSNREPGTTWQHYVTLTVL